MTVVLVRTLGSLFSCSLSGENCGCTPDCVTGVVGKSLEKPFARSVVIGLNRRGLSSDGACHRAFHPKVRIGCS